jgi:hypothetical protein
MSLFAQLSVGFASGGVGSAELSTLGRCSESTLSFPLASVCLHANAAAQGFVAGLE